MTLQKHGGTLTVGFIYGISGGESGPRRVEKEDKDLYHPRSCRTPVSGPQRILEKDDVLTLTQPKGKGNGGMKDER